jgi:hypothetical protein
MGELQSIRLLLVNNIRQIRLCELQQVQVDDDVIPEFQVFIKHNFSIVDTVLPSFQRYHSDILAWGLMCDDMGNRSDFK